MDKLAVFSEYRALLFGIAYRMLSSQTEAEDILQEAWIRWQKSEAVVRSPKSYLTQLTTRLCIDHLRSARVHREKYTGTWLPEPIVTPPDPTELSESLSFAFLLLLDCLSPMERAVFLLREVFDFRYEEIASIIGKTRENCRQIAHRARKQVRSQQRIKRNAMQPSSSDKTAMLAQFITSWQQGDIEQLVALMAEDVSFFSDGGGQAMAAAKPLYGSPKVSRFLVAINRSRLIPSFRSQLIYLNEQPSLLNFSQASVQSTFSFEFFSHGIQSVFATVNPDKLTRIQDIFEP